MYGQGNYPPPPPYQYPLGAAPSFPQTPPAPPRPPPHLYPTPARAPQLPPKSMSQPYPFSHTGPNPYPPPTSVSNPHHLPQQPMPPPPGGGLLSQPPPPPALQGQVLYGNPRPLPPMIQHVPTPPPPPRPPASFASITPTTFAPFSTVSIGEAQSPLVPPPPPQSPPPPPPPPSSPPPPPPSPPPPFSPTTDNRTDGGVADDLSSFGRSADNMPDGEQRIATENGETLRDLPPPPPKPAEKEVVRNIEVLCQYIAKVGPDFENLARVKETGNPQFSFLFGGEPGSAAAIGHEYFQWMKRKCCSEPNLSQETNENNLSQETKENYALSRPLIAGTSSEVLSMEREGSPAVSDMDMEGQ